MFIIEGGELLNSEEEAVSPIQSNDHRFSLSFSRKDISFMTIVLIKLNLLDVFSSFYAINILGFMELNPFAVGFPLWIFLLKFGVCFVPLVCAYMLDRSGMERYMLLPFVCSAILIEFYVFVIAFNMRNILRV